VQGEDTAKSLSRFYLKPPPNSTEIFCGSYQAVRHRRSCRRGPLRAPVATCSGKFAN